MTEKQAEELIEQLSRLNGQLDDLTTWLPQILDALHDLMRGMPESTIRQAKAETTS